ncbi:zinc finger protein 723-like [Condylostylus longicornis]|uniref:zinc finger protein 723-like n=1 Tax=Condylostylus longicornis TaxID=2530218 RepID=UPI00244E2FA8|nr:zinc finger protein 723-like [Condylostylus longicornis]
MELEANIEITSDLLKDKTRIDNSSLILTETIDSYSTSLYESSSTLVNNNGIKNIQIENFDNQPAVNELTNCLNNIFQDETVSLQTVELVQFNRNQHERLHRETKDYHCLDCDKDFKTASQYINHKKTHAFRYECRECDKVYVYGQSLKHHYKTIHPESYENMMNTCSLKRGYECEICSKVYESRLSFLAHKRFDHNWAKIFKCRESSCNKKFFNKEQCDLHYKKKHIKEKSLKCQYCNKSFFMKCHLLVHVKKHTNEKNFKCEYCGRGFIQKIHLKTHLAKHTGLREFICTQQNCNKSFTSSTYLKKHKFMAHSEGLMKFKCNICGEGFPMLFVLNKHKKKHEK